MAINAKYRSKLEPFTGYRDVCILSKNSRVGRKPPSNKQTNKQTNHPKTIHSYIEQGDMFFVFRLLWYKNLSIYLIDPKGPHLLSHVQLAKDTKDLVFNLNHQKYK